MISIIIPVLNEEKTIEGLLDNLAALSGMKEIIVADGGSTDRTKELAKSKATVIDCLPGRGLQCNIGALRSKGDILFFIHADSQLMPEALAEIENAVAKGAAWGCLKLRFDDTHWLMRLVEWGSNFRARRRSIVFGDQGIFIKRNLLASLGGFPDLPLMEDYQLSLNLQERQITPVQVNSWITTSARRFTEVGFLRALWQMRRLRKLYRRGVDIDVIRAMYQDIR